MKQSPLDCSKFLNPGQVGGIETSVLDDGAGRGCRIAWVNTGSPLRYKVVIDRGLDIAEAFFGPYSLTWLSYAGTRAPQRANAWGADWLRNFSGGLVTSCGPLNVGASCEDAGETLGPHGTHSNTPASVETILQPDPHRGQLDFSITGHVRTSRLFGPSVELRRTIAGRLGEPAITIRDQFFNRGNAAVPHAWLLHINLGYPLVDEGARYIFTGDVTLTPRSAKRFETVPPPSQGHAGTQESVAYIHGGADSDGRVRVAMVNDALPLAVVVSFHENQFPRWVNWQRFTNGEFVTAIEPASCGVEGRDVDRQRGWLQFLPPQEMREYETRIEVVTDLSLLTPQRK